MYSQEELEQIRHQIRRRITGLCAVSALLLIAIVVLFFLRRQILTTVLTVVLGSGIVFSLDLLIRPLKDYAEHIRHTLEGPTRETDAVFLCAEGNESQIDGVRCFSIRVTDPDGSERLFYHDCARPLIPVTKGSRVHLRYYDRMLADIRLI